MYVPKDQDGNRTNQPGVGVTVQNIFDDRSLINFLSSFSGTRFVQGRTILLQGFFKF